MEDINSNRHMDRIRDSMLVIIRYILFSRSSLFIPLRTSLLPTHASKTPGRGYYTAPGAPLTCSNNLKHLLPPLLLLPELHPPKAQMLGHNTQLTGLHTVTMSMIHNVRPLLSKAHQLIRSPSVASYSSSARRSSCYFIVSSVATRWV